MSAGLDENGNPTFNNPTYDWDDFCSFLTMFRKVAHAEQEQIYLPSILKIIMRYSPDEVRDIWRDAVRRINAIIEGRSAVIQYSVSTAEGRKKFTGSQVLNCLINGLIFHDDPELAVELSKLEEVEWGCHIFMLNGEIIMPVMNTCIALRNLMFRLGRLPESDFPPPDREP